MFSTLTGLILVGNNNVVTAKQQNDCKNSKYRRISTSVAQTLMACLPQLFQTPS